MRSALPLGLGLLALLVAAGIAGAFINPNPPFDLPLALSPPSWQHWFGCDAFGVDLGQKILAGAHRSLVIGALVTSANLAAGLVIGTVAALAPTLVAAILSHSIDCFMAFPGLLLAILLASIMPRSEHSLLIALCLTGWTSRARFCRALARQLSGSAYVEAAIAAGASGLRVVGRHIWPSMLGQLSIQGALSFGYAILAEASLSFLGLGGSSHNASWGRLLAEGRDYLVEAPHLSIFPGLVFITSLIAFNLIAEGLRQRINYPHEHQ